MRKLVCLLVILISFNSFAQLENEHVVNLELKVKTENEAKPYLLFKAIEKSLDENASGLGIKLEEIRSSLDKKFNVYFEQFKQRRLTAKYGRKYSEELSEEQKNEFLQGLEEYREIEFIKFSRFSSILDGHAFKHLSMDPKIPGLWKSVIFTNINPGKLEGLVKRITSSKSKPYSEINLITELNLHGLSWSDLGLEKATAFTDPMSESWMKWLISNQPDNVEQVNLCTDSCLSGFETWGRLPQDEGLVVQSDLLDDLWLKVSIDLRKKLYHANLNEWQFEWSGRVVLLDANTKRVLATQELHPEIKSWRGLDQKELNSALASQMYRSPLAAFTHFGKKIADIPQLNRLSRLVIDGHSHLGDVISLMSILKKQGRSMNLELQLDLFTQNQAQLLCFYQGEEKSFSDLLSRVKELKSSQSYQVINANSGVHHVLKLVAE